MQSQTLLFIVLAFLVALGVSLIHYYKRKENSRLRMLLTFLRFVTIFSGLLLLINPEFSEHTYTLEKPNLIVMVDGSSSITHLNQENEVAGILRQIQESDEINERFQLGVYSFAETLKRFDSLSFSGARTNISKSLNEIRQAFANSTNAVALITDGNQTFGEDYEFVKLGDRTTVNAVVVGDTTAYRDIRIGQVNNNRYAFLKNQFPMEARIIYSGDTDVESLLRVYMNGETVYRESLSFGESERSITVPFFLNATSTGIKTIQIEVSPLENERNTVNNRQQVTIEVIDEKTIVGIVSSFRHPDLGALKSAIESNEQREVVFLTPGAEEERLNEIDVFILYQPNTQFASLHQWLGNRGGGVFTIAGPETDWNYLNRMVNGVQNDDFGQAEEISAYKNEGFGLFDISKFNMEGFPPLEGNLGELQFTATPEVLAYQRIKGVNLDIPLFFILEEGNKNAFLMGANLWKWRLQSYRNEQNFANFDETIGRLIFLLSSSDKKERLQLDYQNTYENASEAVIKASFFDKTFAFDKDANLMLKIQGKEGAIRTVPMLLNGNQFQTDLSDLEQGDYSFTVQETQERISKSGQFRILDFDLEKQLMRADDDKLARMASNNKGKLYFPNETDALISDLMGADQFLPIQKSTENVVSLIDFRAVLAIMALALALEWIIRKYNGLL